MYARRRHRTLVAWPLVAALVLLAPAALHAGAKCRKAPARTSAELLAPGPYAVGRMDLVLVDASRPTAAKGSFPGAPDRTLPTTVWFPATSAGGAIVDPAGAPYPLVVHSHGLLDNRTGEAYLAAHLASRGYVVAAPDFPLTNGGAFDHIVLEDIVNQPGDVSFVIDRMLETFGAAVDPDRIGVSGLSYGGLTTFLVAFHPTLRDPRVKAALPLAGLGCAFTKRFFKTADVPLLILIGDSDQLVPYRPNGKRAYRSAGAPKYLVTLHDGSHTGFVGALASASGTPHVDAIGCAGIASVLEGIDPGVDPFATLGGKESGIKSTPKRCPLPCAGELPPSSMPVARQLDLTRIVAAAFFDATLGDDLSARCFLHGTLAAEQDDLSVKAR